MQPSAARQGRDVVQLAAVHKLEGPKPRTTPLQHRHIVDPEKSDQSKRKTMVARELELQPQEPETEKEDQTDVTKNFRIGTLGGYSSSNSTNVVSGTISFSWNGFGLGFSNLAYKKESPSFIYDIKASFYELSYTIGQNWSLGLAIGLVGNGMGNIDTSDARYETI